jgi:hypothetical protein
MTDENKKEDSKTGFNLWIAIPSFVFLFGGTGYFGYEGKPVEMGLMFAIGAFGMVFSCLDKFEFFKGAGVEMKLREFRQVVDEGNVILNKLRAVTLFSAEAVLTQVIAMGRIGVDNRLRRETKERVADILEIIKATPDEIDFVEKNWRKYTTVDYIFHILGGTTIPQVENAEVVEEWKELRKGIIDNPPSPEKLRDFLGKHNMLTPEREGMIKDFEYYLANSMHRDEKAWENRVDERLVRNSS